MICKSKMCCLSKFVPSPFHLRGCQKVSFGQQVGQISSPSIPPIPKSSLHLTINPTKIMENIKNKEALMMQVRHLIAIYCYDFMFTPEDAGTAAHQASQIQKYYIGDEGAPDETNFADMFFKGEGPFTNCLESHPDQTGQMMLNRNIFGITDNIIVDRDEEKSDLKRSHLTLNRSKDNSISGSTIRTYALDAIRSTKKAKSFASQFLKNGVLPSGRNEFDLIRHVEKEMFDLDFAGKGKDYTALSLGYKFPKAYAIFQHSILPPLLHPEAYFELKCLAESDTNIGPKTGRHAARLAAASTTKKAKAALLGSMLPGPSNGMPLDQKLDSAHLAQNFIEAKRDRWAATEMAQLKKFDMLKDLHQMQMSAGHEDEAKSSLQAATQIAMGMVGDRVDTEEEKRDKIICSQVEQHLQETVLSITTLAENEPKKQKTTGERLNFASPVQGARVTSLGIIKESVIPSVSVTTCCTVCGIPEHTSNHYCRFPITRGEGWTLAGDDTIICGTPFCISCVEAYKYSGLDDCRIRCPSHHPEACPPNAYSD